jgi:hypothetical protein
LELGVRSQEPGEKRKKEEGRSQKKCFYKYEMLPHQVVRFDYAGEPTSRQNLYAAYLL